MYITYSLKEIYSFLQICDAIKLLVAHLHLSSRTERDCQPNDNIEMNSHINKPASTVFAFNLKNFDRAIIVKTIMDCRTNA